MKTLTTLSKLAQSQIDDLARSLADLENQKRKLLNSVTDMEKSREGEAFASLSDPLLLGYFAAYSSRIEANKLRVRDEVTELDAKIEDVRGHLTSAFQQKSKYDHLIDAKKLEAFQEEKRLEQENLDEFSVQKRS